MGVIRFIRSQLYADFWKFIFFATMTISLVSVIGFTPVVAIHDGIHTISLSLLILIFYIAGIYGFIGATVGFLIVYFIARINTGLSFAMISTLTGVFLGSSILTAFYWNADFFKLSLSLLLFPIFPFVVSLYVFYKLCKRYVKPHLR